MQTVRHGFVRMRLDLCVVVACELIGVASDMRILFIIEGFVRTEGFFFRICVSNQGGCAVSRILERPLCVCL